MTKMGETSIPEEWIVPYNIVENYISNNKEMDFDFFIKFKDEYADKAKEICMGLTTFDIEVNEQQSIQYNGNALKLNPKRCLQDPLELLQALRDYIDFIFA